MKTNRYQGLTDGLTHQLLNSLTGIWMFYIASLHD